MSELQAVWASVVSKGTSNAVAASRPAIEDATATETMPAFAMNRVNRLTQTDVGISSVSIEAVSVLPVISMSPPKILLMLVVVRCVESGAILRSIRVSSVIAAAVNLDGVWQCKVFHLQRNDYALP